VGTRCTSPTEWHPLPGTRQCRELRGRVLPRHHGRWIRCGMDCCSSVSSPRSASMDNRGPDIDVDIEHDRREEVLDYVYGKYNRAQAAITCIVQMYRGPNAIRDSMRAFGYPVEMANKHLQENPLERSDRRRQVHRGKLSVPSSASIRQSTRESNSRRDGGVRGVPRLRSTHVGGFVLSSAPLGDYIAGRAHDDGSHDHPVRQGRSRCVGVPKFVFPRTRRSLLG